MMTRQHFEAIAKVLDANRAPEALVLDFADMCEESNPRFDRERFVAASTIMLREELSRDAARLARLAGKE